MLMVMTLVLMLAPMASPIKMAFSVTMISILAAMSCYSTTGSVFPSASVVISFSSGMMILFCYCALMTPHESKPYKKTLASTMAWVVLPTTTIISQVGVQSTNEYLSVSIMASPLILGAMCLVMLAMASINKNVFSPVKSMTSSY